MYGHYGLGFHFADKMESTLYSKEMQDRYPGQIVAYKTWHWIYWGGLLPIDPRNAFLIAKGSTIRLYGVYFGTDKLGHFHHLGYEYFKKAVRSAAATQEEAARGAVHAFSKGLVSENSIIGKLSAGVYSNGDLAANYVGMKFYFNLTTPTLLQGKVHPPMLVRDGEYWRLADYVKPGAPIFQPFVSDHFNEALNPCEYDPILRGHVARRIHQDADSILTFYADPQGQVRSRQWFDDKVRDLWTYWGENYGHNETASKLVTIGANCFDADMPLVKSAVAARPAAAKPAAPAGDVRVP
jgi:hypothetical protein